MSDADTARLRASLDLVIHLTPKLAASAVSPGLVRLDHWSGLFLERGDGKDRWVLKARTWGAPAETAVHGWHMLAALAARQLDPTVTLPARRPFAVAAADISLVRRIGGGADLPARARRRRRGFR
jgi:hypothetical protein